MGNLIEIDEIVARLNKELFLAEKRINGLPDGVLSYECRSNYKYLLEETYVEGKRRRRSLNKDHAYAAELLRRELLEKEIGSIRKNLEYLHQIDIHLQCYDINDEIRKIRSRVPILTDDIVQVALRDPEADAWENAPYEKSIYRPEELRHFTSRGLKVRSKSEVLIAERLYHYKQRLRYEQIIHFGKDLLIPDFTIRRSDGKIFIWEHEGLTNNKDYLQHQLGKHQKYASIGYVPWDNLIITYDNADGNIDLRIVDSEIRNKLLL